MGAKTALLAFADVDIRAALSADAKPDQADTETLVSRVFPGHTVEPGEGVELIDGTNPDDGHSYAAKLPGLELLADRRLAFDRPSELPAHLLALGKGRRIVLHGMHSVVDRLAFAIWQDGVLVRSLSLSPDGGIIEDIGEPLDFERPYWAGAHPVEPVPGFRDEPYPLPFHPLELGEGALQALFGFVIEGASRPGDIDPEKVWLHGFRVSDPTSRPRRTAPYAELLPKMGKPKRFTFNPDGSMREIGPDDDR
jgi:Family of unknown function (DUF6928)